MADVIVHIGRFQPPTLAHLEIIKKAQSLAKKVIVIVGSAKKARSVCNPWTSLERIEMLRSTKEIDHKRLIIAPIPDSNYDFSWWLAEVEKIVKQNTNSDDSIGVIGYKKDDTSYYLDYFPKWKFVEMPKLYSGLSATQVRERLFENNYVSHVTDEIGKWLTNWIVNNDVIYSTLKEEYHYIKKYKDMWKSTLFTPVFVTTDAIVICKENILLIRRGNNPGKNLYAMPGGFLEQTEFITDCAIRELRGKTRIDVDNNALKKSLSFVKVFDDPFRDQMGRSIAHVHLFNLELSKFPNVKLSDSASDVRWMSIKNLDELQDKFFGDHYQIIKNVLMF
ncbi:MAG: NUDIX domain-containing protein [Endomicrobium sp.]|uniref:NUDIX domain-containing protein n=1 Tax=Candidatus Endomicrobiellum pyrsonymphae TaxID=1408203 RepID=UPI003572326A|nr:NUDIX domain-containing protein [Endomicrobium sp.]